MRKLIYLLAGVLLPIFCWALPDGFVYFDEISPQTHIDLRYLNSNNFLGRPVNGYFVNRAILTQSAAETLLKVQDELSMYGLGLLVYDAYRPQRAVDDFVSWAGDQKDTKVKPNYYPNVDKSLLLKDGYIAEKSGHSHGSTVDLTLVSIADNKPLDMGTHFDFFGPESWPNYPNLLSQQKANRLLLRLIMTKYGFKTYPQEWWHFTLENEPYPNTFFDFEVK